MNDILPEFLYYNINLHRYFADVVNRPGPVHEIKTKPKRAGSEILKPRTRTRTLSCCPRRREEWRRHGRPSSLPPPTHSRGDHSVLPHFSLVRWLHSAFCYNASVVVLIFFFLDFFGGFWGCLFCSWPWWSWCQMSNVITFLFINFFFFYECGSGGCLCWGRSGLRWYHFFFFFDDVKRLYVFCCCSRCLAVWWWWMCFGLALAPTSGGKWECLVLLLWSEYLCAFHVWTKF